MAIDPTELQRLFYSRDKSRAAHSAWLEQSRNFIASGGAERLAAVGNVSALDQLCFAGFCFWHLSLTDYLRPTEKIDPHMNGNDALCRLAEAAAKRPELLPRLNEVNDSLDLAAAAFRARLEIEIAYPVFQRELFARVIPTLAADEKLRACAQAWSSDSTPVSLGSRPAEVAKIVTAALVAVAKDFQPEIYADCPDIKANIFFASQLDVAPRSGSYNYRRRQDGTIVGHYNIDAESPWYSQTLPFFIGCAAHETLHILQRHLMTAAKGGLAGPFLCEAMTYEPDSRNSRFDLPRRTYPIPSNQLRSMAKAIDRAYLYRPSEYYAHQFDFATERVLCEAWGIPLARRYLRLDVSGFIKETLSAPSRPAVETRAPLSPLFLG